MALMRSVQNGGGYGMQGMAKQRSGYDVVRLAREKKSGDLMSNEEGR